MENEVKKIITKELGQRILQEIPPSKKKGGNEPEEGL